MIIARVSSPNPPPSSASDPLRAMVRGAVVPTALVGPVALVVAAFAGGGRAALGAVLGYAVTMAFFLIGMIVLMRLVSDVNPLLFMASALAVFLGQVIFLLLVILLLRDAEWLDGRAFGFTALAVALVWQVFQVLAFLRTRRAVYDAADPESL